MRRFENPFLDLTALCWRHAEGHRKEYVVFYALSVAANFALLLLPVVLRKIFNTLEANPKDLIYQLSIWMLAYGSLTLLYWALHGPSRHIERRLAFKIKEHFIDTMYQMTMALPTKWHENHHSGDTTNRIEKSSAAIYDFAGSQHAYILYIVTFIVPLVALTIASPIVGGMALVAASFAIWVIRFYDKRLVPLLDHENDMEHHFCSVLSDYVGNITTVLSLRIVERTRVELMRVLGLAKPVLYKIIGMNEMKWFSLACARVLIEVVILFLYIILESDGNSAAIIGSSVMVYQYLRRLSDTSVEFAASYENITFGRTACESVRHLEESYRTLPPVKEIAPIDSWRHIRLEHLDFYHHSEKESVQCLKDVSFDLHRGQKIALVGESGAGKSSLLGVMRGIYDVDGGVARIDDGAPIDEYAISQLTTLIPQDPEIFANSIRYNITTGLEHTEAELERAIGIACFNSIVARLPSGVETDIREKGVNLSGGEKQRLALARGVFMAESSSILLLDEPTSSVDAVTERNIYQNIFAAFPNHAIVSSIHRLNLLQMFDVIYFMDKGRIIESGTLAELLAAQGAFNTIWQQYHKKHKDDTDS